MRWLLWLLTPALALVAAGAGASPIPAVTVSLQVGSNTPAVLSPTGQATTDPNQFAFVGQEVRGGWTLGWDMTVDPDPFVTSTVSVLNSTAVSQTYTFIVTLPIAAVTPSSLMGGSVQGGITSDASAGTLSSFPSTAIYTALIDGAPVATLFPDPISVSSAAFTSNSLGSALFGSPIPSAAGPAALSSIGIQLKFTLTPGDQASFTSVFVVEPVPEPGTILLLGGGLVGLVGYGRRYSRA